jgi:hypothetical protein
MDILYNSDKYASGHVQKNWGVAFWGIILKKLKKI